MTFLSGSLQTVTAFIVGILASQKVTFSKLKAKTKVTFEEIIQFRDIWGKCTTNIDFLVIYHISLLVIVLDECLYLRVLQLRVRLYICEDLCFAWRCFTTPPRIFFTSGVVSVAFFAELPRKIPGHKIDVNICWIIQQLKSKADSSCKAFILLLSGDVTLWSRERCEGLERGNVWFHMKRIFTTMCSCVFISL